MVTLVELDWIPYQNYSDGDPEINIKGQVLKLQPSTTFIWPA